MAILTRHSRRRLAASRKRRPRMAGGAGTAAAISRELAAEVNGDIKDAGLAQQVVDAVRAVEDADTSDKPAGPATVKAIAQIKRTLADIDADIIARFHKAWTSGAAVAEFKKTYTSGEKADAFFRDETRT